MARLLAFTPDQVASITGLSRRQLDYWSSTGFFGPEFRRETNRFNRMYSFRDVVGLKAIARLRTHLPLQELRRAGKWLHDRYDQPWAELRLIALDGKVVFGDTTGKRRAAGSDQLVFIDLGVLESEVERQSVELTEREHAQVGRVVRHRNVQHNQWIIDGTRIPTSAIWDFHQAGYSDEAIAREYPRLTIEDIRAAIEFESTQQEQKAS